jgi:hypothetical protein
MIPWLRGPVPQVSKLFALALAGFLVLIACGDDEDIGRARARDDAGRDSGSDVSNDSAGDATGGSSGAAGSGNAGAGGAGGGGEDAATDAVADGSNDVDAGNTCPSYPLTFTPDPEAEARARTALENLAPTATLMWNPTLGTLQSAIGLELELPGCVSGVDALEEVWRVAEANRALFQLDRSEWQSDLPTDCATITDQENTVLRVYRNKLGAFDIQRDIFGFSVTRVGTTVRLRNLFGTYVPEGNVVLTELPECNALPVSELVPFALRETYDYTTFFRCTLTGSGTYQPTQLDQVSFDGIQAMWSEDSPQSRIVITFERMGRLIVDPANYTEELLASDANCPEPLPGDGRVVGFRLIIDAVTGQMLSKLPGLDCVVC